MRRLNTRDLIDRRVLAWVYLFSFLLPPLGAFFWYRWRKYDPERSKNLGLIAIVGAVVEVLFVLAISPLVIHTLKQNGAFRNDPHPKEVSTAGTGGTLGTCPWHLDDEDVLVIEAGTIERGGQPLPWNSFSNRVTGVRLEKGVVLPEDCSLIFSGLANARSFSGSGADASHVTNMSRMFKGSGFETADMGDWDVSGVESTFEMFYMCSSLRQVSASGWKTSRLQNMNYMFNGCSSLTDIDVSGWDVSSAKNMNGVFSDCKSLRELDVSGWNTSKARYMAKMFSGCKSLTSLDVSRWDVSGVSDAEGMFSGCESLEAIGVSAWNTSSMENMNKMFDKCRSLQSIDLSGWNMLLAAEKQNIINIFGDCKKLKRVAVGEKCSFIERNSFPEATQAKHPGQWYSQTDHVWYDLSQIAGRSGIADTYTNSETLG